MSRSETGPRASGSSDAVRQEGPDDVELDDSAIDQIFAELQEKRQSWEVVYHDTLSHFKVCLLGGAWSKKHLGVVCDVVRAYASGKEAQAWCIKFGFPTSARFGIRRFGQDTATALAVNGALVCNSFMISSWLPVAAAMPTPLQTSRLAQLPSSWQPSVLRASWVRLG